jgi:hypothetical protein
LYAHGLRPHPRGHARYEAKMEVEEADVTWEGNSELLAD